MGPYPSGTRLADCRIIALALWVAVLASGDSAAWSARLDISCGVATAGSPAQWAQRSSGVLA